MSNLSNQHWQSFGYMYSKSDQLFRGVKIADTVKTLSVSNCDASSSNKNKSNTKK